jgi:hypothetical protein
MYMVRPDDEYAWTFEVAKESCRRTLMAVAITRRRMPISVSVACNSGF